MLYFEYLVVCLWFIFSWKCNKPPPQSWILQPVKMFSRSEMLLHLLSTIKRTTTKYDAATMTFHYRDCVIRMKCSDCFLPRILQGSLKVLYWFYFTGSLHFYMFALSPDSLEASWKWFSQFTPFKNGFSVAFSPWRPNLLSTQLVVLSINSKSWALDHYSSSIIIMSILSVSVIISLWFSQSV